MYIHSFYKFIELRIDSDSKFALNDINKIECEVEMLNKGKMN